MTDKNDGYITKRIEVDITVGTVFSLGLFLFIVLSWEDIQLWQIIAIAALYGAAVAMTVKAAISKTQKRLSALSKHNELLRSKNLKLANLLRQSMQSQTQMTKQLLANEKYMVSIMDNYEALVEKCIQSGVNVEDHWNADVEKTFKDMRAVCEKTGKALEKLL